MAIYEISNEGLRPIEKTSFAAAGLSERYDIQQHLRRNIGVILPDVLIIAEEFGEWADSRRRIDLLGVDTDGNLVVIELKRTEDGGHMELQAIRYAAMVSNMSFDEAVGIFQAYLRKDGDSSDARERLLEHLEIEPPIESNFGKDVKIVLVSADFGKELTTAVLWLNKRDIDIRCVRLVPYKDGERTLINIEQVIPLPEAAEYQVKLKEKEQKERQERATNLKLHRFWETLFEETRDICSLNSEITPHDRSYVGTGAGISRVSYFYVANRHDQRVELYIDYGSAEQNTAIFDQLIQHREEIEAAFGDKLDWQGLFGKRACRIAYYFHDLGDRDDEENWPEMHRELAGAMERFQKAMSPYIAAIRR